jgi:beta-glucosidase-like glycosyl hydrolase
MNKILKDELGFRGYVLSDWNGMRCVSLTMVLANSA